MPRKLIKSVVERWLTKSIIRFSKSEIKVRELYKPQTLIRKTPFNLNYEDNYLFSKEYVKKVKAGNVYWVENAILFDNGCVFFNKQIITDSAKLPVDLNDLLSNNTRFVVNKNEVYLTIHHIWSFNYFHWLCDVLPKLIAFQKNHKTEDFVLLLPLNHKVSYVEETLKRFNFKNIIYFPEKSYLLLDYLCFVGPLSQTGNIRPCVAKKMRSFYRESKVPKRKIYISRKFADKRKAINEDEIISILINAGFEIINSEKMSFREQVSLFSECETLMSVHGAGLTNMLFMAGDTKVVELRLDNDSSNNCYYSLASALDINYYYQCCKVIGKNVVIDPFKLKQLLQEI